MPGSDDLFGDDPATDEFVEELERHRDAIYERIYDYMEEVDIHEAYVAQLLIDAMIRMRMTAYAMGVESPSVAGIKMDLDRLGGEVGEFLREAKKGAEEYIRHVKEMRAEAEGEAEAEAEEEGEEGPE
jgi:NurA-like 5'-3' nuclease